jgi:putative transposase
VHRRRRIDAWRGFARLPRHVTQGAEQSLGELNGEADHVLVLIALPPNLDLSNFVNKLNVTSSRPLRRAFADKVKQVDRKHVFWSCWRCVISCGDAAPGTIHRAAGQADVRAPFTPAKRDSALADALGATSVEPPREEVPAQFSNAMKGAIPDNITIATGMPLLEPGRSR